MAHNRLRVVLAVRQRMVDEAHRILVDRLRAEADAERRVHEIDEARRLDREVNPGEEIRALFLEMSGSSIISVNAARQTAIEILSAAAALSTQSRAELAAAKASAEAVETLILQRLALEVADRAGKDQHILDDIARNRSVGRQGAGQIRSSIGADEAEPYPS